MPDKLQSFHEFMPEDVWKWKIIEQQIDRVLSLHNYQEIRLSVLQDYSVLHAGITALMDTIEANHVTKQVLSLNAPDSNVSLLSLRPEGTISVLHHTAKRFNDGDIHRFFYHGPMFRKDKHHQPMEFYQLGVELLGSDSILSENEIISLGMRLCRQLGLQDARLEINSYGCEECRPDFFRDMRLHIESLKDSLCKHCYTELLSNPLTDTRCQEKGCTDLLESSPQIQNYLCDKCKLNFHKVKKIQANLANEYKVNHHLFKNFSYYNETVFDIIVERNGVPVVIGGGGRYDYLSQKITGKKIPAVGFYLNLDIVFGIMTERRLFRESRTPFAVYICAQTQDMEIMMLQIAQELHEHDIVTVLSTEAQSTETEIKIAFQKGCNVMIILRDENIREGKVLIRNLGKEHQDYIQLNQIINEILIARKATIQEK